MRLKYAKLMMNLGNAVQALVGFESDVGALNKQLRKEGMRCLDAAGIEFLTAAELVKRCRQTYELGEVEGHPRQGGSSWQGFMRGRRSIEADYLNGEVVLLGALHGVATPLNSAVLRLANQAAMRGLAPGSTTVEEIYRASEEV
jgi:2-dehydropantoate 2-reductase